MEACSRRVGRMLTSRSQNAMLRSNPRCLAIALIILLPEAFYAGARISGKVHDPDGLPLKGVTVTAVEDKIRVFSDDKGEFTVQPTASKGQSAFCSNRRVTIPKPSFTR